MSKIYFETKLFKIGSKIILLLPKSASIKLPSRGMVMVQGKINSIPFQSPLEPDGRGSHWLKINNTMQKEIKKDAGDTVTLEIEPVKDWPEPIVPDDLRDALLADPKVQSLWKEVTPMARWDWIRWIGATKNPETRKRRIVVELSKLKKGEKRPCCFNRTLCCDTSVSNNGVLLKFN